MSLSRFPRFREWTLGAKLAVTFVLLVAGAATVVSVAVITRGRMALDDELRKRGVNLVQSLTRLSVDPILQDDLWGLYKIVRDVASGTGDRENVVAYAMVLDASGRVLAHSDPARYPMGEPIADDPVGITPQAVTALGLRSGRRGNERIYDLAAPIVLDKQRIGVARIGLTTRHLETTIGRMTRDALVISTILSALVALLALVISRRMTRPLRELGRAVDRLAEGQLDLAAVRTSERDEIGRLAERFNRMAARLRENISEIQATKQYLENLLENANDFIYTLDLEGRITYVNHQFLALGLRKDELLGRPIDAVVTRPPELSSGAPRPLFEVEVKGADGQRRTLVVGESVLLDAQGRPIGRLGIAKDVSERKELEARLIKSERLASVGELAAALAHEIRNPLGSLFASARMLAADSPQAAGYDRGALVRVIAEETRRLEAVLSDFLAFARPRPPRRRPQVLNDLVAEVVESLRLDSAAGDKAIWSELDPAMPPAAVDRDQIKQVVWNVVRNALDASPRGAAVRVATRSTDGYVVLEVTDVGAGIPASQRARLFEPFQTTKPGGSGLGLAIAHRIVTAHAGTIDVASEPGAGTTVRIALPREGGG